MGMEDNISNSPHEFTDDKDGKVYKFKMIDADVKKAFKNHYFAATKEAAREMKDLMTPQEWQLELSDLTARLVHGEFNLESAGGVQYFASHDGVVFMIMTLANVDANVALDIAIRHGIEIGQLVKTILHQSIPAFKSAADRADMDAKEAKKKAEETAKQSVFGSGANISIANKAEETVPNAQSSAA